MVLMEAPTRAMVDALRHVIGSGNTASAGTALFDYYERRGTPHGRVTAAAQRMSDRLTAAGYLNHDVVTRAGKRAAQ
jgi:hypothetical protein